MRKTKSYAALFVILLVSVEILYYQYLPSGKMSGLYGWLFEVMGNRYIILVIQGTTSVLFGYFAVRRLVGNDGIRVRYGNCHRLVLAGIREIWKESAAVTGMLAGVTVLVYMAGEGFTGLHFWDAKPVCLFRNLLLMDVAMGHFLLALLLGGIKEKPAVGILFMILVANLGASASVFGGESSTARFTWIGNVMVMDWKRQYGIHVIYWGIWILGSLFLLYGKLFVPWEKVTGRWGKKNLLAVYAVMAAVILFAVYGFFFKNYANLSGTHPVSDWFLYFRGFEKLDVFLLMYLFYHLPFWAGVYLFMVQYFNVYAMQYLLRGGNMYHFYRKLLGWMVLLSAGYYGTGIIVLGLEGLSAAGNAQNAVAAGNPLLLIMNLLQQEWLLLLCMFGTWLLDREERHTGTVLILTGHLVLCGLAAKFPEAAAWFPFTGGVYCLHSSRQKMTFFA